MTESTYNALWSEVLGATEHGGISMTDLVRRVGIYRDDLQMTLAEWQAQGRVALRPGGLYVVVVGWRASPRQSGTYRLLVEDDDEAKTG